MKMARIKLQVTLPEDVKQMIEHDAKISRIPVSSWVERALVYYLEKHAKKAKKIDLGI